MRPLDDRVLVRPVQRDRVSASGIVIPDIATEKPQLGVVVAVGPGSWSKKGVQVAPDVVEGESVLFSKYGGTEIRVDGEDLLILRESDILAKSC